MVEQSASLHDLKQELVKELDELWEKRAEYELHSEIDNGNISVRFKFSESADGESKMVIMSECKLVPGGLVPNDFSFYPEKWPELIKEINPRIEKVIDLGQMDGMPIIRCEAGCPWPLSNRVMCQWRTGVLDMENQNHYFILSSRGCESKMELTEEEKSNFAVAYVHVGGFKFMPVKDESGKVIGTTLFNVQSSNPGGNIPTTMSNKVGPPEALKALQSMISIVTKHSKLHKLGDFFEQCAADPEVLKAEFLKASKEYQKKEAALVANGLITEE